MTNKHQYQVPELEQLPMTYVSFLCESDNDLTGGTEDYGLVEGFEW